MRHNFALALFAASTRAAFSMSKDDHGHGHSHANAVELKVLDDTNYNMMLTYMVEPDKFGDSWLVFEPKLVAETEAAKF